MKSRCRVATLSHFGEVELECLRLTLLISFALGYLVRRAVGTVSMAEVSIHWPLFAWLTILILAVTTGFFAGHWLWP